MESSIKEAGSVGACPEGFCSVAEAFKRWVPVRLTFPFFQELHAERFVRYAFPESTKAHS